VWEVISITASKRGRGKKRGPLSTWNRQLVSDGRGEKKPACRGEAPILYYVKGGQPVAV